MALSTQEILEIEEKSANQTLRNKLKMIKELASKVKEWEREFEEQKASSKGILSGIDASIKLAQERLAKLEEMERVFNDRLEKTHGMIATLTERHREISLKLLAELTALQKDVDLKKSELRALEANLEALEGKYKRETDEYDALLIKKSELKEEIDDLEILSADKGMELQKAIDDVRGLHEKAKQYRSDFDTIEDDKKELAMRLHDARVLDYRLKPEFQERLAKFLAKR